MFGLLFSPPQKKGNSIADELGKKLLKLPPAADLLLAAAFGVGSVVTLYKDDRLIGLLCICLALFFASFGIMALSREMRDYKFVKKNSSPDILSAMHVPQFEAYLMALFRLDGNKVRLSHQELHRLDDADFIATCGKTVLLVQFNHFDETTIGVKPLESLCRAAAKLHASGVIAVIFGRPAPEARDYAIHKGITLMSLEDVLAMAIRLVGDPTTRRI
jgi:hypothetical protein